MTYLCVQLKLLSVLYVLGTGRVSAWMGLRAKILGAGGRCVSPPDWGNSGHLYNLSEI